MRTIITDQQMDAERALYHLQHADLLRCRFEGPADGESALKEAHDVSVKDCSFSLRYPFWHITDFSIAHSTMNELTRAAIWYAADGRITDSELSGIKAVRECKNITIDNCTVVSAEFGWKSQQLTLTNTCLTGEYPFFDSRDLVLNNVELHGKYSFQYVENLTIEHCDLDTKDAFWHSKNVVVKDSIIKGEYLGWYAENLTFIRCKIIGTQPLCYCKGLTLVDCTMEGADFAFEYSEVQADIKGRLLSVKNPKAGRIVCDGVDEIITEDPVIECTGEVILRK